MLSPTEIRTLQVARRVISPLGRPPLVRDLEAMIARHAPHGNTFHMPGLRESLVTDGPDAVPVG